MPDGQRSNDSDLPCYSDSHVFHQNSTQHAADMRNFGVQGGSLCLFPDSENHIWRLTELLEEAICSSLPETVRLDADLWRTHEKYRGLIKSMGGISRHRWLGPMDDSHKVDGGARSANHLTSSLDVELSSSLALSRDSKAYEQHLPFHFLY